MTRNAIIDIGILGADGRMGKAVIRALGQTPKARLSAALTTESAPTLGKDAGQIAGLGPIGVPITHDLQSALSACDVLIDFSAPSAAIDAALAIAGHAAQDTGRCRAMVSGTTGFTDIETDALEAAANSVALLRSGNFSPGVTALAALVELATEKMGRGWDIEILEMHHKHKVDAPSGTALLLGEAAAQGRSLDLEEARVLSREGVTGARQDDDIGFAALRGGGVVGRHEVRLASDLEMITLSHDAFDRSVFAKGAVDAALWVADRKAGLYSMRDMLGFA